MNRRSFLSLGIKGAFLGLAMTSGLALTKLPEVDFVRGKLKAADISRSMHYRQKKLFERAYREAVIEAFDVRPLALGGKWGRSA